MITTRGDFGAGLLVPGATPDGYRVAGRIPGLSSDPPPRDLLLVVHGLNNSEPKALYKFGIAAEALRRNGYRGSIVGFSWDADTSRDPFAATGYRTARRHAVGNGKKLARFIADYQARNPDVRMHLLGYSMGARLVLEALRELDTADMRDGKPPITTVHLVGASVDDEEVELGSRYGRAIERRVVRFINYFSHEDNKLGQYYFLMDGDQALGENDVEHRDRRPRNYTAVDAEGELRAVRAGGELDPTAPPGDNHSGYLGLRDHLGRLVDDGVMDLVARSVRGSD